MNEINLGGTHYKTGSQFGGVVVVGRAGPLAEEVDDRKPGLVHQASPIGPKANPQTDHSLLEIRRGLGVQEIENVHGHQIAVMPHHEQPGEVRIVDDRFVNRRPAHRGVVLPLTDDHQSSRPKDRAHGAKRSQDVGVVEELVDRIAQANDGAESRFEVPVQLAEVQTVKRNVDPRLCQVLTRPRQHRFGQVGSFDLEAARWKPITSRPVLQAQSSTEWTDRR